MTERLTSLAALKDWLDITNDDSNSGLTRLIDAASQFVLGYLNREGFAASDFTQNFKGNGKDTTLLKNWPILSVSSVGIAGSLISASVLGVGGLPGSGYVIGDRRPAPQSIDLYGFCWYGPCQVIYRAGFMSSQDVVISTDPFTPGNGGQWIGNLSVLIDGVAAELVSTGPLTGQYTVTEEGVYSFSAADIGKTASVSYSYAPWDVSFAVTELCGEWYMRKDRIGVLSKTLGGQETITFSQKDMNDSIRGSLQNYKNEIPF